MPCSENSLATKHGSSSTLDNTPEARPTLVQALRQLIQSDKCPNRQQGVARASPRPGADELLSAETTALPGCEGRLSGSGTGGSGGEGTVG
ncbi:hypothetical protein BC936DRAFT_146136 [Jimgerdemannia flammicorona]|uniref:Uncharacterized protein n=1 Tax=Jimgerdemannia flammicorona TaxID=994334 RepID=A0A433D8A4_9FUNG|nr:hypothetical protein BC936DRAFT_146136 [Jimgerdemannia flammicorona]